MPNTPQSNLEAILSGEAPPIDEKEYVPGTIHLIDLGNALNVKKESNSNIILQPQPSSNINDVLRWSQKKKKFQFALTWTWAFIIAVVWYGPYYTIWMEEFSTDVNHLNLLSAAMLLGLAFGCIFLQPLAMKYGRRGIYLFCTLLAIMDNALGSQAKNFNYIIGSFMISGISGAPCDSLVPISSTDVFFIHERSKYISLMVLALYAGSFLGPVVGGYIPTWKWCFYIEVILMSVLFIVLFFLLEDTTFERVKDSGEKEILEQIKSHETILQAIQTGELTEAQAQKFGENIKTNISQVSSLDANTSENDASSIDPTIPKRSYAQKLKVVELEYNDKRPFITIFTRPFLLVGFPALIWGGFVYGAQIMWLSLLNNTQSQIFTGIYGFSTSNTGLTNLAPFVGSIVGTFYGGNFVDWLSVKLAERNHGVFEPEFRLYAMVVPTILNSCGLIAYGVAANNKAAWEIPAIIGGGFLGFSMSASGPICLSYAADCYAELASESMVLILFVRNILACGFTFGMQPWIDKSGLVGTTWLMFMMATIINGSFIIMIIYGKSFRRMTKNYYYKLSDPNYTPFKFF